jgi:hypothetical protein
VANPRSAATSNDPPSAPSRRSADLSRHTAPAELTARLPSELALGRCCFVLNSRGEGRALHRS